ncbi:hypothetical protein [Sphingosinicella sp. CPCC 101087]|uniref:hypothetical protein n=1 Tax=Sphingosinicella sp. CPCC 101087 TaxID=2497754 RepID=UPI00101DDAAF|nr:hypothetical protein [Sphingosinicella sp. CPCC 101087]
MTTQATLWTSAGATLALAVAAGVAEWRRTRRHELDEPGWVPWRGIQVACLFGAMAFVVLAVHA